ncbi:hypothetical protein ACFLV5_03990 [Chloroflexota bacterium]
MRYSNCAFLLFLLLVPLIAIPNAAAFSEYPTPYFYSKGLTYGCDKNKQFVIGDISTVAVEIDKFAIGGIEQDIRIVTGDSRTLTVEILNWYYTEPDRITQGLKIGVNANYDGESEVNRVLAVVGEIYHYVLAIHEQRVHVLILDSDWNVVFWWDKFCGDAHIESVSPYIEYWYSDTIGRFYYYGYVSIRNTLGMQSKTDSYHKADSVPFGFYLINHNWGDQFITKGEIDDR